ncbi:hypothetical protein [Paraburkholderia sp. UCT31]|uniref:hypothetical protein n=1 Tax=Paraburkholderia sp. UCT31 TaxID=2615209 RepID=UPI001655F07D|nr:hypothetical protein [Paraburkholderia sp. UCT31]
MAMTTVYQYRVPGQPATNRRGAQPHYATRAAIEHSGHAPLLDTALELDESLLDANGFARLEYLTYRIHVRHGAYAGLTASDGAPASARLQLMAGDYDARLTARVFNPAAEAVLSPSFLPPCVSFTHSARDPFFAGKPRPTRRIQAHNSTSTFYFKHKIGCRMG